MRIDDENNTVIKVFNDAFSAWKAGHADLVDSRQDNLSGFFRWSVNQGALDLTWALTHTGPRGNQELAYLLWQLLEPQQQESKGLRGLWRSAVCVGFCGKQ